MDYGKLARVNDNLDKKVASGKDLEVETVSNPLDALATEKTPTQKTRVVILDSAGVKAIMDKPREERRKFLSKLTDSQRRRVLQMVKQNKVEDAQTLSRLNLIQFDDLLTNAYYEPSTYNIKNLEDFVAEVGEVLPEPLKIITSSVVGGNFDVEENKENIEALKSLSEELGVNSVFLDVISSVNLEDSVKVIDSTPLTEELVQRIVSEVKEDLSSWDKKDMKMLNTLAEDTIAIFVSEGLDYTSVSDLYWETFTTEYDTYLSQLTDSAFIEKYGVSASELLDRKEITDAIDSILDKIEEGEYFGDEVEEDVKEKTVLEAFEEALTKYIGGDSTALESLAATPLEEPAEESQEVSEEEVVEDNPETSDIHDAITLAKGILSRVIDTEVLDRMVSKVPVLSKYKFKASDCAFGPYVPAATDLVIMPMTCGEYQSYNKKPLYFDRMLAQMDHPKCPYVDNYQITEDNPCLIVNGDQLYYPHSCSLQDIQNKLDNADRSEWAAIVNEACCPLECAFEFASATDNLGFIDNRFYKKTFNDDTWYFEEKPEILSDVTCSGIRFADEDGTDTVRIYGQPYKLM